MLAIMLIPPVTYPICLVSIVPLIAFNVVVFLTVQPVPIITISLIGLVYNNVLKEHMLIKLK